MSEILQAVAEYLEPFSASIVYSPERTSYSYMGRAEPITTHANVEIFFYVRMSHDYPHPDDSPSYNLLSGGSICHLLEDGRVRSEIILHLSRNRYSCLPDRTILVDASSPDSFETIREFFYG